MDADRVAPLRSDRCPQKRIMPQNLNVGIEIFHKSDHFDLERSISTGARCGCPIDGRKVLTAFRRFRTAQPLQAL